jgi:hypothetical protein
MLEVTINNLPQVVASLDRIGGWTANTYDWGSIVASEAAIDIRNATDTWTHKPNVTVSRTGGGVGRAATTTLGIKVDSDTYQFVDKGTKGPYPIPKTISAGVTLAFNSRFKAKSRPNSLRAYRGMSAGPVWFAKQVQHPGIKARNFSKLAYQKAQRDGARIIDAEIRALIAGRALTTARLQAAQRARR